MRRRWPSRASAIAWPTRIETPYFSSLNPYVPAEPQQPASRFQASTPGIRFSSSTAGRPMAWARWWHGWWYGSRSGIGRKSVRRIPCSWQAIRNSNRS